MKVIIVISFLDDEKVYFVLEVGVISYLLKMFKVGEIVVVICCIYEG